MLKKGENSSPKVRRKDKQSDREKEKQAHSERRNYYRMSLANTKLEKPKSFSGKFLTTKSTSTHHTPKLQKEYLETKNSKSATGKESKVFSCSKLKQSCAPEVVQTSDFKLFQELVKEKKRAMLKQKYPYVPKLSFNPNVDNQGKLSHRSHSLWDNNIIQSSIALENISPQKNQVSRDSKVSKYSGRKLDIFEKMKKGSFSTGYYSLTDRTERVAPLKNKEGSAVQRLLEKRHSGLVDGHLKK